MQEAGGGCAVDDAVIEGEAERDLVAGDNLVVHDCRLAADAADAEDGGLRQVDDGGEGVDAKGPKVGDGENATLQVVHFEFLSSSVLDQLTRASGKLQEREGRNIAKHRNKESVLRIDGDADMGAVRKYEMLPVPPRGHLRMLLEGRCGELDQDVCVRGDDFAAGGLKLCSQVDEVGRIRSRRQCYRRGLLATCRHSGGDGATAGADGDSRATGARTWLSRCRSDVLFANAARFSGPGERFPIDAEFLRDTAGTRAGNDPCSSTGRRRLTE